MHAEQIDDVIELLDGIIAKSVEENTRFAFFAALYRIMTINVKNTTVTNDIFKEPDRVRELAVAFSNRYFDAYQAYVDQQVLTSAWRVPFDASGDLASLALQHLLMGINAHISLDLGICVAELNPDGLTENVKADYFLVNEIIGNLVNKVQDTLGTVSPWLIWIDRLGGLTDEAIASFSVEYARTKAWEFAEKLVALPKEDWVAAIRERDRLVAGFALSLRSPSLYFRPIVTLVRFRENNNIQRTTEAIALIE